MPLPKKTAGHLTALIDSSPYQETEHYSPFALEDFGVLVKVQEKVFG